MSSGWEQLNRVGKVLAGLLLTAAAIGMVAAGLGALWLVVRVVSCAWHLSG